MLVYGPVPSRRLGRSLGVNTIPSKWCTLACVYCQVGRTDHLTATRRCFHDPDAIVAAVARRLQEVTAAGEVVDHVSIVPDGEPTLDRNLGETIAGLRELGRPVAVISNGSLIDHAGVRRDLARADWVSLKVDAAGERTWRRLNRPHGRLDLAAIGDGMRAFAAEFGGTLATETMLVAGHNDTAAEAEGVAAFLADLDPDVAYVSVPTRPPARPDVHAAPSAAVVAAHEILARRLRRVELLLGYEGDAFSATGDAAANLVAITAVHPMREEAAADLLGRAGAPWSVVEQLLAAGTLATVEHAGHRYLVHRARAGP